MTRVAVLCGGQLGRMLGLAGIPLGFSFAFLDPVAGAPGAAVGELVVGGLDDIEAARRVAVGAAVVTYEWEGVPAATARALESLVPVYPPARALDVSQDRVVEKQTLRSLGIATAAFQAVDSIADLRTAVDAIGLPAVLARFPVRVPRMTPVTEPASSMVEVTPAPSVRFSVSLPSI